MKCHVCGLSSLQGTTLYRQNETGVAGIWACMTHDKKQQDFHATMADMERALDGKTKEQLN